MIGILAPIPQLTDQTITTNVVVMEGPTNQIFIATYCSYNNHNRHVFYRLHGFSNDQQRNLSKSHGYSGSSTSRLEQPDQRVLVSSPLISQEQYKKNLAMLSSSSINSQANLAGIALCTINFCLDY
jgi:hypothetical protein